MLMVSVVYWQPTGVLMVPKIGSHSLHQCHRSRLIVTAFKLEHTDTI